MRRIEHKGICGLVHWQYNFVVVYRAVLITALNQLTSNRSNRRNQKTAVNEEIGLTGRQRPLILAMLFISSYIPTVGKVFLSTPAREDFWQRFYHWDQEESFVE